jgi:hypothetical protein
MNGLQAWLNGLVQRPLLLLHKRVDGVKNELNHEIETLRHDMDHRAYRLEVRVAAWGVTVGMLVVCGLFLLMGLWLGLSTFIGPVGASFVLAALFGLLAAVPFFLLPRELAQVDSSRPPHAK